MRVTGFASSGGDIFLEVFKRDESIDTRETIHVVDNLSQKAIEFLFNCPTFYDPFTPFEDTIMVYQVYRDIVDGDPLVQTRARSVSLHSSFLDYIRSKIYEAAHPTVRGDLVRALDAFFPQAKKGLVWKPGIDISKNPITIPSKDETLSSMKSPLWSDMHDVKTLFFFHVFNVRDPDTLKDLIVVRALGTTTDGKDKVFKFYRE